MSPGQVTLPSIPMGNCFGRAATATKPSVPIPISYQRSPVPSSHGSSAGATVQDRGEAVTTATSSFISRAPMPLSRALSQDRGSSQPHRDDTNYPSWGNILSSEDSHRQERFPQGTPLHSPGRIKRRVNSENVLRNGHTPGSSLTRGAVEGQEGRSRFPPTLQGLLSNDFRYAVGRCPISPCVLSSIAHRFRILVVGKVCVIYAEPKRN
jgi:hypothetical protein